MKVCILSNDDPAAFQSSINAFIADKKVIDMAERNNSHLLDAPTFPNGFEKVKHNGNVYFVERED